MFYTDWLCVSDFTGAQVENGIRCARHKMEHARGRALHMTTPRTMLSVITLARDMPLSLLQEV